MRAATRVLSPGLSRRGWAAIASPPPGGAPAGGPDAVDLLGSSGGATPTTHVNAYDATGFEVNGRRVDGSLLVGAGGLVAAWAPQRWADVDASSLAAAVLARPELVVLGTGAAHRPPPSGLVDAAVEALPTPQAAALFNVLSQEGRSVMGAFIPAGEVE